MQGVRTRWRRLLLAAATAMTMLATACTTGGTVEQATVLPDIAIDVREAADDIVKATRRWHDLPSGYSVSEIQDYARWVDVAVDAAGSTVTTGYALVDVVEASTATTAASEALASLERLAEIAQNTYADARSRALDTDRTRLLRAAYNDGWDCITRFWRACEAGDWDDAEDQVGQAHDLWLVEGREDAEQLEDEHRGAGSLWEYDFATYVAFFELHLDVVDTCRDLIAVGRDSAGSGADYAEQQAIVRARSAEARAFELPDSWHNHWYYYGDVRAGLDDIEAAYAACIEAVEELEELLAAPAE